MLQPTGFAKSSPATTNPRPRCIQRFRRFSGRLQMLAGLAWVLGRRGALGEAGSSTSRDAASRFAGTPVAPSMCAWPSSGSGGVETGPRGWSLVGWLRRDTVRAVCDAGSEWSAAESTSTPRSVERSSRPSCPAHSQPPRHHRRTGRGPRRWGRQPRSGTVVGLALLSSASDGSAPRPGRGDSA